MIAATIGVARDVAISLVLLKKYVFITPPFASIKENASETQQQLGYFLRQRHIEPEVHQLDEFLRVFRLEE